jgi:hypothetical protein
MMFVEANRDYAVGMAKIAEQLSPDEVQINTPLRPCGVTPLSAEEVAAIEREFSNFQNVFTVYGALKPEVMPFDLEVESLSGYNSIVIWGGANCDETGKV